MNNTNGGTRSREETYLNDGRIYYNTTVSPTNRDSEYERIPDQINHFDNSGKYGIPLIFVLTVHCLLERRCQLNHAYLVYYYRGQADAWCEV